MGCCEGRCWKWSTQSLPAGRQALREMNFWDYSILKPRNVQ